MQVSEAAAFTVGCWLLSDVQRLAFSRSLSHTHKHTHTHIHTHTHTHPHTHTHAHAHAHKLKNRHKIKTNPIGAEQMSCDLCHVGAHHCSATLPPTPGF